MQELLEKATALIGGPIPPEHIGTVIVSLWFKKYEKNSYFRRDFKLADAGSDNEDVLTFGYGSCYYKVVGLPLIRVKREKRETKAEEQLASLAITFYTTSSKSIENFHNSLLNIKSDKDAKSKVKDYNQGWWKSLGDTKFVLPTTNAEGKRFIYNAKRFLADADLYEQRGVPHKKSYLLTGEPGTGKTSLVALLAKETGRDIYTVGANKFSDSFQEIPKDVIVLVEDIDMTDFAINRENTKEETLSSSIAKMSTREMMNSIDGIVDRSFILIATTNHPDVLDPALTRKGRLGEHYHIGPLTPKEQEEYLYRFYSTSANVPPGLIKRDMTIAELQSICEKNMESFGYALEDLEAVQ